MYDLSDEEETLRSLLLGKLSDLLGDSLFRDSSILVTATVVGGGMDYLYQLLMGRLLGPEQYGVFGALFGLFYILMILSLGVGYCSTRYISGLSSDEQSGFLRGFALRVGGFTILIFVGLTILSPTITNFLKIDDTLLVIIVAMAPLFGLLNAVNNGALRGLQRFPAMGGFRVGKAAIKLVGGVALVLLGFGVYGALGAVAAATFIILLGTTFYLRRLYLSNGEFDGFGEVYQYALPSILVAFCFTVPANADVIIVKHLFTSTEAGLYTSATVLGKILIFLPMGITNAMFPKVSSNHFNGQDTDHLLKRAMLYTGGTVLLGALVYATIPEFIITLFFGPSYTGAAALVPWYGMMVTVFSLSLVLLNYSHARHETTFVKTFTLITILEILLIYLLGNTVLHVIQTMLIVNIIALILGWTILTRTRKRQKTPI